jgi:hypothetical protein
VLDNSNDTIFYLPGHVMKLYHVLTLRCAETKGDYGIYNIEFSVKTSCPMLSELPPKNNSFAKYIFNIISTLSSHLFLYISSVLFSYTFQI